MLAVNVFQAIKDVILIYRTAGQSFKAIVSSDGLA